LICYRNAFVLTNLDVDVTVLKITDPLQVRLAD